MDKMIQTAQGEVVITNDGATILKHMSVMHPAARMVGSRAFPVDASSLISLLPYNAPSSSTFPLLKISRREMEPPPSSCSLDLSSGPPRSC